MIQHDLDGEPGVPADFPLLLLGEFRKTERGAEGNHHIARSDPEPLILFKNAAGTGDGDRNDRRVGFLRHL